MLRYKNQIVVSLIVAFAAIFYVEYVMGWVFVLDQNESGETIRELRNPLTIILFGREFHGQETTYTSYDITGRLSYLTSTGLALLLAIGLFRYFSRNTQSSRLLTIFFVLNVWRSTANSVFMLFYYAWNQYNPESDFFNYHRDPVTIAQIGALAKVVIGLFIIKSIHTIPTITDAVFTENKFKGIRGFHLFFDRFLLFFFGNNAFIFLYLFNRGFSLNSNLSFWMIISLESALIACYFLFEWIVGITPSKLLTGMAVIDAQAPTIGKVTMATALKRTLIRLVPFEAFSFLSRKGGWHDRWSGSSVYKIDPSNARRDFTRIVMVVFWILVVNVGWYLLTWPSQVSFNYCSICDDMGLLPLHISVMIVPIAAVLFTGWLSVLAEHRPDQPTQSKNVYLQLVMWWIPIHNFTILKTSMKPVIENMTIYLDESSREKIVKSAAILRSCFVVFYLLLLCELLAVRAMNERPVGDLMLLCGFVAILIWCIGVLIFASNVRKYCINPRQ